MMLALGALAVTVVAAPHRLRFERASPVLAASIWLSALALRALAALFGAIFVLLYLPASELFSLVTHWCWHTMIPFVAAHLPLSGHVLGEVAIVAPSVALATSAASVVAGLWLAGRRVRRLLAGTVIGPGPRESLLLAGGDVVVAAAGLRRPRVVVSAGALLSLDDEELSASLEHERGHIARRHRYVLVAAELCRALARLLPGTRVAHGELLFHLERDADRYAIARRQDPAALASAICKAAGARAVGAPALALGGGAVTRRIRLLLDGDAARRPARSAPLRILAGAMVTLACAGFAVLPAAAHAGYHEAGSAPVSHRCAGAVPADNLA